MRVRDQSKGKDKPGHTGTSLALTARGAAHAVPKTPPTWDTLVLPPAWAPWSPKSHRHITIFREEAETDP